MDSPPAPTPESPLTARLGALADRFVPEPLIAAGGEPLVLARRVVAFTLIVGLWGPVFSLMFGAVGYRSLAQAVAVSTLLFVVTPLVLAVTRNPLAAGLWATLQYFWVVVYIAWHTGGTSSPAAYFLAALPLFGSILQGRRRAPWLAMLAVGTAIGLYTLASTGALPTSMATERHTHMFHFLCTGALIVMVYALTLFHQALAERALADLAASNDELERAAERDRQARHEVQDLNGRLVTQARVVGRAEIAKNVLHNVGNALNHVNLLAAKAMTAAHQLRIHRLAQAVALLDEHRDDLASWLSRDNQGVLLRDYLGQLSARLGDERDELIRELNDLLGGLEELRVVVRMQDTSTRRTLLPELVDVGEVVDHAIRMTGWTGDTIFLERDLRRMTPVLIDRQRLLEILVHLLSNARNAVVEGDPPRKVVRVVAASVGGGRLKIDVIDNGIGIPAGDLERVFQHGFTTRDDGHGFGLHACALSAHEMGGTLVASSEGPGRGATFSLDLPQYSPTPMPVDHNGRGNAPTVTPPPKHERS